MAARDPAKAAVADSLTICGRKDEFLVASCTADIVAFGIEQQSASRDILVSTVFRVFRGGESG